MRFFSGLRIVFALALAFVVGGSFAASAQFYPTITTYPLLGGNEALYNVAAVGDLNGDGLPDVIATEYLSFVLNIVPILANPSGGFTTGNPISTSCTYDASTYTGVTIATADLNGDHKTDVIVGCGGYVIIFLGNGDGTFANPTYTAVPALYNVLGVGKSDPNIMPVGPDPSHPGYLEIFAPTTSGIAILQTQGSSSPGTYTIKSTSAWPSNFNSNVANAYSMNIGDFNGDGFPDLTLQGPLAFTFTWATVTAP